MSGLVVTPEGPVLRLTLAREAKRNALDAALMTALTTALEEARCDPTIRVVVLAAQGPVFCSGGDQDWMRAGAALEPSANRAHARVLADLYVAMETLPQPILALVQGHALGAGLGLVAAADLAIAADTAQFAAPEVRLGIPPSITAPYVVRAVGPRQAALLFTTGRRIRADEARRLGLIHEVVPPEGLAAAGDAMLREVLQGAPGAVAGLKPLLELVRTQQGGSLLAEACVGLLADARAGAEAHEARAAARAKRPPSWTR